MIPVPAPRPGEPTQRVDRLRRRQDFIAVLHEGKRVRHRLIHLGLRPNGLPESRVGYAIGKRVGSAVVRNRIRRRLRAIVHELSVAPGYDLVLTGQPASVPAPFSELRGAVEWCARRGGILTKTGESS